MISESTATLKTSSPQVMPTGCHREEPIMQSIGTGCASTHRDGWCGFLFHFQQNWVCQLCLPGCGSKSSFDSLKVTRQPEFQPCFSTGYCLLKGAKTLMGTKTFTLQSNLHHFNQITFAWSTKKTWENQVAFPQCSVMDGWCIHRALAVFHLERL